MKKLLRLALALATLPLGLSPALAADPIYGPGNQAYAPTVLVDPTTGKPASLGGATADQGGTNATDGQAASTANQHALAYEYVWNPVTGTWDRARGVNGVRYAITPDARSVGTLDATKTSGAGSFIDIPLNDAATVGLNFQGLAASGATVSYFITNAAGGTPSSTISSINAATGVSSSSRTTDGDARIAVGGHAILRVQVTTAGTGTVNVASNVSAAGSIVDIRGPIPPGSNAIGSVGALGVYNSTIPTLATGAAAQLQLAQNGDLKVLVDAGAISSFTYANATSAPPSYTNGTQNPITQTLAGALRVDNATESTALGAPGDPAPLPGAAGGVIAQLKTLIGQSASYTSAGTATASGTLPNPATMPAGGAPRGFAYSCDGTTPANSKTTLTLAGGGTTPLSVATNNATNTGMSATAATAVTGCSFQALY